MKVKIFTADCRHSNLAEWHSPQWDGGTSDSLEEKINRFLAEHPGIRIVDIKFASSAAPVIAGMKPLPDLADSKMILTRTVHLFWAMLMFEES